MHTYTHRYIDMYIGTHNILMSHIYVHIYSFLIVRNILECTHTNANECVCYQTIRMVKNTILPYNKLIIMNTKVWYLPYFKGVYHTRMIKMFAKGSMVHMVHNFILTGIYIYVYADHSLKVFQDTERERERERERETDGGEEEQEVEEEEE